MIVSVYIKDGNLHLYNEKGSFSGIGGVVYELGRPLLDFVCYEPERFDDAFFAMTEAFDNEHAHEVVKTPAFMDFINESMTEMQKREAYVFFYAHIFYDFIKSFVESPRNAVEELGKQLPRSEKEISDRLSWVKDFEYPKSSPLVTVVYFNDKEKRLFRAVKDVVKIMGGDIRKRLEATIWEIEFLLHTRNSLTEPPESSLYCLYLMEIARKENEGRHYFIENTFKTFYGIVGGEIVQLYEVDNLNDLFRFEFVKMIEHNIFIKKCKNCERFFIPKRRADVEYCERIYADTKRKCSEIGAMLRYEKKVACNPVLEAHKKAYRRFNSRTRAKKMTQNEFLCWSEEASRKRDNCLAGNLPFDEFVEWLERGRIRRSRDKNK